MSSHIRLAIVVLLLSVAAVGTSGQAPGKSDRAALSLASDPQKVQEVRVIVRGGMRYVGIDDISRLISGRTHVNTTLKKVELILPSIRFKCTDASPFVVITRGTDGAQSTYQLGGMPLYNDGTFIVPADEFIAMVGLQTDQKILFSFPEAETKPSLLATPPAQAAVITQPKEQQPTEQLSVGTADKAGKYSVTGIDVEEKKNGYLLRIRTTERLPDCEKTLQGKEWLYLTIPRGRANVSQLGGMFSKGLVKRVIPVQSAQSLQISFQFREKVESAELVDDRSGTDILIALRPVKAPSGTTQAAPNTTEPPPVEKKPPTAAQTNAERQRNKWKLDVVVLDAGHGGHDPGTIGSMGTNEKDVTLGIALKLGALIEKNMPGVKVIYTRKTDHFVELYRRGQIANEANGKLFISIHCNSTPKKSTAANGFEIYLLRPGKTETAIEIAEQENAVVRLEKDFEYRYQKLTEENYIILTMAQSAYVKQSERFAELLEAEMAKKMVYQSRGVKQAGFYVLVGASMPNLLIETGYLSNRKDETLLRGLAGQYLAAESIYDGLKKFKTEYEKNFMED